ncbi:MAG: hypothetical protein AAF628_03850 [Planctomycetota bacterium]
MPPLPASEAALLSLIPEASVHHGDPALAADLYDDILAHFLHNGPAPGGRPVHREVVRQRAELLATAVREHDAVWLREALIAFAVDRNHHLPLDQSGVVDLVRVAIRLGASVEDMEPFRQDLVAEVLPRLGYTRGTDLASAALPRSVVQRLFPADPHGPSATRLLDLFDDSKDVDDRTLGLTEELTTMLGQVADREIAVVNASSARSRLAARQSLSESVATFQRLSTFGQAALSADPHPHAQAMSSFVQGLSGTVAQITGASSSLGGIAALPALGALSPIFSFVSKFLAPVFESKRLKRIETNLHFIQGAIAETHRLLEATREDIARQFRLVGQEIARNRALLHHINGKIDSLLILVSDGFEALALDLQDMQLDIQKSIGNGIGHVLARIQNSERRIVAYVDVELRDLLDRIADFTLQLKSVAAVNRLADIAGLVGEAMGAEREIARAALQNLRGQLHSIATSDLFSVRTHLLLGLEHVPAILTARFDDEQRLPSHLHGAKIGYLEAVRRALYLQEGAPLPNPFALVLLNGELLRAVSARPDIFTNEAERLEFASPIIAELADAEARIRDSVVLLVDTATHTLEQLAQPAEIGWRDYVATKMPLSPEIDADPLGLAAILLEDEPAFDDTARRTRLVVTQIEDQGFESGRGALTYFFESSGELRHRGGIDLLRYGIAAGWLSLTHIGSTSSTSDFEVRWHFDPVLRQYPRFANLHGTSPMQLSLSLGGGLNATITKTSFPTMVELYSFLRGHVNAAVQQLIEEFAGELSADTSVPLYDYKRLLGAQSSARFTLEVARQITPGTFFAARVEELLARPDVLSEQINGLLQSTHEFTSTGWELHVQRGLSSALRGLANSSEGPEPRYLDDVLGEIDDFVSSWLDEMRIAMQDFNTAELVTEVARCQLNAWVDGSLGLPGAASIEIR